MRELRDVKEFNANLNLDELTPYTNEIGKRFGEFSFACGCGRVHSIHKITNKNPLTPTVWEAGRSLEASRPEVWQIFAEKNRILFYCARGFFTMVALTRNFLKNTVRSDFFIKQDIIDSAENGFGLYLKTRNFAEDFNIYRKDRVPTKNLKTWLELEEKLISEKQQMQIMPSYSLEMEDIFFKCPCDEKKHKLNGHRGDYEFNQPFGGFHVPVLIRSDGERILSLCSAGFYCYMHVRPTFPIEWIFKCETMKIKETINVPILPRESNNSSLPPNIIGHIRFIHHMAVPHSF